MVKIWGFFYTSPSSYGNKYQKQIELWPSLSYCVSRFLSVLAPYFSGYMVWFMKKQMNYQSIWSDVHCFCSLTECWRFSIKLFFFLLFCFPWTQCGSVYLTMQINQNPLKGSVLWTALDIRKNYDKLYFLHRWKCSGLFLSTGQHVATIKTMKLGKQHIELQAKINKSSRGGRKPKWLSNDLLDKLRDKKEKYRQWKHGWVAWKEYKKDVQTCRNRILLL